ncbi:MAG: hypothetical protein ILP02_03460, partial [Clostridia bacterium]|nr:hypothetical protein [Clostridia bacterium]
SQKEGSRKDFLFALPRLPKGNGNQRQKAKDLWEKEQLTVKSCHLHTCRWLTKGRVATWE